MVYLYQETNRIYNVTFFSFYQAYERMNLADALTSKTYTSGSVIIQQGDPADGMYFVETGEVSVTVVGNDGSERQVRLRCH